MSNAIRIESIEQFVEQISKLELSKNHTRFFRGHSNNEYEMIPSIYRDNDLINNEDRIIKDVLTECAEYFPSHEILFDKLVRMQHYDCPTRLLDISYNALVGLYFAVNKNDGKNTKTINCQKCNQKNPFDDDLKDGEVIILDIPNNKIKYQDSDTVAILSALSLQKIDFDIGFYKKIAEDIFLNNLDIDRKKFKNNPSLLSDLTLSSERLQNIDEDIFNRNCREGNESYFNSINNELNEIAEIITLLNDVRKDKPYFLPHMDYRDVNQVICVKSKANNRRIERQQGAFLIFGINEVKSRFSKVETQKDWSIHKLIVDKNSKKEILKNLERVGISRQTLFPELDSQATHIISRYKDN